jgi:hypothetical protein
MGRFVLLSVEPVSGALDYRIIGALGREASVAKRKSLVVRIYQAHRKASTARERERERTRAAAAAERERAARAREAAKAAVEARHAEARARTEAIRERIASQEKLPLGRAVDLRGNANAIGQTFDKGGPEAFAGAVDGP